MTELRALDVEGEEVLTILNNYQHGFVAIPVVLACKQHGLFEISQRSGALSLEALTHELQANSGHLQAALHMLVSMQWLSRDPAGGYLLMPKADLHRRIPEEITTLLSFPMHDYLNGEGEPHHLDKWVELSNRRWDLDEPTLAQFLDGLLMIPLLLALRQRGLSEGAESGAMPRFDTLPATVRDEVVTLFAAQGWLDHAGRAWDEGGPDLNDAGRFMITRSFITATVASYRPMLMNIAEVIFGNCTPVFGRDADGNETHVDRTLNVLGSGFQHERYFSQMEESLLALFNREPYEAQPRYIADMGCGDGTLLKKIYDIIQAKALRGQVLDAYPITLIGIDYNTKSLEATAQTLSGYDHIVIQGDIGNPVQMIADLEARGIRDPENILHVRSFLDHDRPYQLPQDAAAVQARADIPYHGVFVDREGHSLPPAAVMQSLVEHLGRWSSIIGHHGLLLLEVHALESKTTAKFLTQSESLHFDAYQRFSQQLLVEADQFIMAAAEVGLFADPEFFKKYPKTLPFTRITQSYFRKFDYTVRHPRVEDVPGLAALEAACLPASQVASEAEIRQRIVQYPEGQNLLEFEGRVVAVAYSQRRLSETTPSEPGPADVGTWSHDADGAVAELLYVVCPEVAHNARGHELLAFMTRWLPLKDGIETVTGVSRCERTLAYRDREPQQLMAFLQDYIHRYPIRPEDDTLAPETELHAFGMRWLLRIFQDMGVMTAPGQVYALHTLRRDLGILSKYERLYDALVRLLEREQVVRVSGEHLEVLPLAATFALQDVDAACERFAADFKTRYVACHSFIELMFCCLARFADVITGKVEANDVVFPGGSMDVFFSIFRGNPVADYFHNLVAELVLAKIRLLRETSPAGKLSVLELGAGVGSTTTVVLDKIQPFADDFDFYYTDISSSLTRYGERVFQQQFPWIHFALLNIEEDAEPQGFKPESIDIIYASNVLHATRSVAHTLAQVKSLLKPGGLLILNNFTAMKEMLLFTGSLLHGYWLFDDPELRIPGSCLLSAGNWQQSLIKAGFVHVEARGLPFEDADYRQSVLFCEKSGDAPDNTQPVQTLSAQDGRMMIESAIAELIGPQRLESLTPDVPLLEFGLDSMELLEFRLLLTKTFDVELDTTFLFQHNTVQKIEAFFQEQGQVAQQTHRLIPAIETAPAEEAPDKSIEPTPTLPALDRRTMIASAIEELIGSQRLESLTPDVPLLEFGLDSMELLEFRLLLTKTFGVELDTTFLFQHNTVQKIEAFFQQNDDIVQHVRPLETQRETQRVETRHETAEQVVPRVRPAKVSDERTRDIAIIGVAIRLPGELDTLDDFWTLLKEGQTAVGPIPEDRYRRLQGLSAKPHLTTAGFLDRIDEFDAPFFRISPREAEFMDPQQRMLLELGWAVMEDAGYKPSSLSDSHTGVFIGACHFDYLKLLEEEGLAADALASTGTSGSILANRLSYFYNFQGPSWVVDTACSSSLVAVHEAVRELRHGSCEQALAGGVNLISHVRNFLAYDQAGMLSQDSTCYAFDERANGFVRGEGAALVLLKRLDKAVRDHDRIYAVIKGSAVNHGGQAISLTAPNPGAHGRLLAQAWQDGEVAADSVTYLEAHGTGTPLGDPIEVEGIRLALNLSHPNRSQGHTLGLGSVKANIGHLEGAAGIAGLIKLVLCLQHRMLPKSINFHQLNPEINLTAPLHIVDHTQPWPSRLDAAGRALPRRGGVSAFGFGGANAHVVLEEVAQEADAQRFPGPYLFVLSARNAERLRAYAERFVSFLQRPDAHVLSPASLTYTLQHGREEMDERLAILFTEFDQLCDKLQRFCSGEQTIAYLYQGNAKALSAEQALLTAGAAGRIFLEHLFKDKDYERLALLWIRGARIDWSALFGPNPPEKMRLPTYPFARQRYWMPTSQASDVAPSFAPDRPEPALPESMSRASTTVAAGHDDRTLLLTPVWESVSPSTPTPGKTFPGATDRVVIVEGGRASAVEGHDSYRRALQQRYPLAQGLHVRPEDSADVIAERLEERIRRLGGGLDHIFWLASGASATWASNGRQDRMAEPHQDVLMLFRMIKALVRVGCDERALGWTVFTTQAQPVHARDLADPAHAGMHGLIGSMAKEFSHWQVRLIDLEAPHGAAGRAAPLSLDDMLALPPDPHGNAWVCRGLTEAGPRWLRQALLPVVAPPVDPSGYRSGGVYVVIGGAGGIGEAWSEYMMRTYDARIVWIGRRHKEPAIQAQLDRLAKLGPAPLYLSADATDGVALERAYEAIKARYGQINGVVHAAIVLLDQALTTMDEARFRAGLAAKIDTSVQMARVFQNEPLDFVLFFSSIMTFLKAPGQSNYAAGCTFQDALAHQLRQAWSRPEGGPVVKVMYWGYWGSVGIVASEAYRERLARSGFGSIDPPEAMAALECLVAGPLDQLALIKTAGPVETLATETSPLFRAIHLSEQVAVTPGTRSGLANAHDQRQRFARLAGTVKTTASASVAQGERLADRVRADVMRAASRALDVAPENLDADVDLREYGFDAVSLGHLAQQLNRAYGLDAEMLKPGSQPLTANDMLAPRGGSEPTLRGVAALLLHEHGGAMQQAFPTEGEAALDEAFDALLAPLLWGHLRTAGMTVAPGAVDNRWLHESREMLVRQGLLQYDADGGAVVLSPDAHGLPTEMDDLWQAWDRQKPIWLARPDYRARVTLAEAVLRVLPALLDGTLCATDVLFPDGSMAWVEKIYKDNTVADYFNTVLANTVTAYLQDRPAGSPRVRILEVGAGTGGTSALVLHQLRSYQDIIQEYCYTDVSQAFLNHAEKAYGQDYPYLTYHLFNVEQSPVAQGIDLGAYDLVIAANVLHATRHVRQAVRHTKACLKAGGLLLVNEISRNSLFYHLTFGLLEGWWRYEDEAWRLPGCPALDPRTWQEVLALEGFHSIFFPADDAISFGQQVIVAASDGVVRQSAAPVAAISAKDVGAPAATVPSVADADTPAYVHSMILDCLSRSLKTPAAEIDGDVPFSEYGLDSILTTSFVVDVNDQLGIAMNKAIVFDHSTVNRLADHVVETYGAAVTSARAHATVSPPETPMPETVNGTHVPAGAWAAASENGSVYGWAPVAATRGEPEPPVARATDIAVVGMAGQFPDAADVHRYWENLLAGRNCVHELPPYYLDQAAHFSADKQPGKTYCRWGGILQDRDCFDPLFFHISPREALSMSPHQRLILQESWKSLEDAGYNPKALAEARVGVFVGAEPAEYFHESFTGASDAIVASRLSYALNLRGPALVVNTGCSSSGVAIHLACESLRHGESDMALAGGVFILTDTSLLIPLCAMDMLSATGRCHTFDTRGDGMVLSEGVGMVALKRLEDAIADADPILGVIEASGVNQDGASNGITAPSGVAQEALITSVYDRFRIDPDAISYVEAHGTGTKLGDPVEANALVRAFRHFTAQTGFCSVGSAKAAIGHTGAGAGVAGLIKVLLSLKHRTIPGLVGLEQLNPLIEFDDTPFYVHPQPQPWHTADGKPRRAAVNSFGHSGTNAHLVIREYEPVRQQAELPVHASPPALIPLSAQTAERLTAYADVLRRFLVSPDSRDLHLADVAYTLQVGREAMRERVLFRVNHLSELVAKLEAFADGQQGIDGCWAGQSGQNDASIQVLDGEKEGRDRVALWMDQGQHEKIAEWWTRGSALDWRTLYGKGADGARFPRRVSLPAYPFAKERYWAPGVETRQNLPAISDAEPEAATPVWSANGAPLPLDEARIADILANGELLNRDMDDLLCKLFWGTLQSLGLGLGETLRFAHLDLIAGIDKKYGRWFAESLNMLTAMGYLEAIEDSYRVLDPRPVDMDALWREWDQQRAIWSQEPNKKIQLALVDATLRPLPDILTGRRQVTELLFPNASIDLVEGLYKHNLVADFFNEALADSLVAYIQQRLKSRSSEDVLGLRLFEIGAGTGGATDVVLSRLQPYREHIREYCFTDVSHVFLMRAQKRYGADYPFFKTRLFDMEVPVAALDMELEVYDVVMATNAIHAARDVRQPVRNANMLLKPRGVLLLNELSRKPQPFFIHLSLALLDGWWLYEDPELRIPGCPGLWPETWERVLREEGFGSVCFPAEKAHVLAQQIVMAERDGGREQPAPAMSMQLPIDAPTGSAGVTGDMLAAHVKTTIIESLSESLQIDTGRISVDDAFADYGLDSITGIHLILTLNRALQLEGADQPLSTTDLFDHGSVNQLAAYIVSQFEPVVTAILSGEAASVPQAAPAVSSPVVQDPPQPAAPAVRPRAEPDAIAVIGMSGRFAGSATLEAFWQHLITGTDLVQEVSRWNLAPYFDGLGSESGTYCYHGSFLDHIDRFDPLFFNISALEARYMDPQQRIFLEESWKALEDAGYAGDAIKSRRCGVYVGCVGGDYEKLFREAPPEQAFWGNAASITPARIAYYLDLQGPAIAVDTACSSSAVAMHLACQALLSGETDMALAGGVYIQSTPYIYTSGNRAGMLSPAGRCFTFDARADGFVPGEGAGVLLLKRLSDALADGDHIHGVIRGSGINQDGHSNGITAPSAKSQERLEREVYDRFGINPEQLQMIEAHGTGTTLGDPIEVEALTRAFRHYTDNVAYCALGTVKTNIGHTSMAAGVAGVLKILLALKHKQIPPSINYASANPRIALEDSPFYVNTQPQEWTVGDGEVRRAATSAFGFSGTNAHLIIEEAPPTDRRYVPQPGYLFVLSARTAEQLRRQAEDLLAFCDRETDVDLGNMCYTLLLGRSHLQHRLACVVRDLAEWRRYMHTWLEKGSLLQVYVGELPAHQQRERTSLTRYGNQCIEACRQTDDAGAYLEHLATIADLYMQGCRLDVARLFDDGYTKLPLPTYPFAQESYWAPGAAWPNPDEGLSADEQAHAVVRAEIHPLLHRNTSDLTAQRFSSCFSGREFFLADHRINGQPILPGVVQLEMVRAAVVAASGQDAGAGLRLHNMIWGQPVVAEAPDVSLHISLAPQMHRADDAETADQLQYDIYSETETGERRLHGQGTVALTAPEQSPSLDLAALQAQISQARFQGASCYETFRALGIDHGPSLQGLDEVFCGGGQVLARLRPPADGAGLVMHPAVLDAAWQAAYFLVMEAGDTEPRLPFALQELELFRPGATPAWAWLRRADDHERLDIDLCDERGDVCIRCTGLAFRARPAPDAPAQTLLLEPGWQDAPAKPDIARVDRHLVVLCEIDTVTVTDIEAGLDGCRCLALPSTEQPIAERFENHAMRVFAALQELLEQRTDDRILLQIVCPVQGAERVFAALDGLLYVAVQEKPSIIRQLIEIDVDDMDLVAKLRESSHRLEDTHIRYWRGKRQAAKWQQLHVGGQGAGCPWKDGATYLITGGLGGLGLIFAKDIATRTQGANLILAGRSPLGQNSGALDALRKLGARVEYRQADVSDAHQVDGLIHQIREQMGSLQGVLHSAGVHHDALIVNKTTEEFARVLAPKVAGTANLDRATRDLDLDFFILFSSIAVAMGNSGQADYATANAYMDAYAAWRNHLVNSGQRHGRTLSINWPLWQEGGMRADRDIEHVALRRTGLAAMESAVGISALEQALATGRAQVMVLYGDAPKLLATLTATPGPQTSPREDSPRNAMPPDLTQRANEYFKTRIATVAELPAHRIAVDTPLEQYGFDSIMLGKATNLLEETFGSLSKTLLFEYPSIGELATYFVNTYPGELRALLQPEARARISDPGSGTTGPAAVLNGPERATSQRFVSKPARASAQQTAETDIAIIGCTGRFPQADNLAEFWENLKHGRDGVTDIPRQRWDHELYFDSDKDKPGKTACKWGGFIEGVDQFDPLFFNLSPREAGLMDPQERLFLETAWHLFEETGHTRKRLQQHYKGQVGVFVGSMYQQYHLFDAEPDSAATVSLGSYSAIANRVSYFFNLQGPSLAIDTMCSSSLTAVHMACESLVQGGCNLAVAGGVNLSLHPKKFVGLSRAELAASNRDRRSFSDGDGYLPAEGVGAVLLKPLAQAVQDGDEILAVIKSTATNHGGQANGYSVPNPKAQAQLIIDNFEKSGIDPRTMSYVEAAANGSALGDAIEMAALNQAFARFTQDREFCAIGAVKSNIGHPEAASGMAQLAKVILQLRHGQLAPSIHTTPLNPDICFADTAFYLPQTLQAWQRPQIEVTGSDGRRLQQEVPRRAAINSFGAGGSNAHLILEEYTGVPPVAMPSTRDDAPQIVVFSAKNLERLQAVVGQMQSFLASANPQPTLADLAYTLQVGREAMTVRLAMVVRDRDTLLRGLTVFLQAPERPQDAAIPMFTGDVDEAPGIGDLLASEAVFQVFLQERNLEKLALYWTQGGEVPWEGLHEGEQPRLVTLPLYPFARERYWLAASGAEPASGPPAERIPEAETLDGAVRESARTFLLNFLAQELKLAPEQIRPHRELRAYGADSITGMRLIRAVEAHFHMTLSGRDLFEHSTVDALSAYLADRMDARQLAETTDVSPAVKPAKPDVLEQFAQGHLTLEDVEALLDQGKIV